LAHHHISPVPSRCRTFCSSLDSNVSQRWCAISVGGRTVVSNIYLQGRKSKQTNSPFRLSGFTYTDVLHIYGISRAGYIPQLFSIRLPNPTVVYELLHKAGASVLVYDPSFESIIGNCPLPIHRALSSENINFVDEPILDLPSIHDDDETAFIFHTSGSTSGSPKLVQCSYRWLQTVINKSYIISQPHSTNRQDVTVFM
jgi:hypothetical protein